MDRIKPYLGGGAAALFLIPAVYAIFFVSGAGSGVVPLPDSEGEREPSEPSDSPFPLNPEINWAWFYGILAGTIVFSLIVLAFLAYRRPRFGPDYHAPVETDPFEREFQELLHLLSQDQDPSRSIRLIFDAAETKINHLPKRVSPETPFEWADRVQRIQPHLSEPLRQLCSSYATARYASDRATPYDRDVALQSLRQLKHLSENIVVPVSPIPVLPWA